MEDRKPSSLKQFKELLGKRESSGDYKAKNSLGYLGKYQFGKLALQDTGYKDAKGNWTGKDGVDSEESFLQNKEAQEEAMDKYVGLQRRYLKSKGATKHIGKEFNGIPVTESGLAAAAHLIGAGGINEMLNSGKVKKDAYGTPATEYLEKFKGIDLDAKEEEVDKLKKLQELKQGIQGPIKQEEVVDPATALGFEDGGFKDILTQMGLPKDRESEQYVTVDDVALDELTPVESDFEPTIPADNAPKKEEPQARIRSASPDSPQEGAEEASKAYDAAEITSGEPEKTDEPLTMATFEKQYRNLMEASEKEKRTAEWASAATYVASMLDKFSATPRGIKPMNFKASVPSDQMNKLSKLAQMKGLAVDAQMTPYQRQSLELREKELDSRNARKDKEPTFEEKETKKLQIKEKLADSKEDRENKKEAKSALKSLDSQEEFIDKAIKLIEEGASTGPIDQYTSKVTPTGQKLQKAINNIALDKMTKMFAGMSKAIDSDAERAFFQSTQPSMSDFESVNLDTLRDLKANIKSLREKTKQSLVSNPKSEGPVQNNNPSVGTIIRSQGKTYKVIDEKGNLEEVK